MMSNKRKIIIAAVIIVVVLFIIGSSGSSTTNQSAESTAQPTTQNVQEQTSTETQDAQPQGTKPEYKIVFRDENVRVENYEVLIQPGADGKAAALDVRTQCKKPCNIYVYDDSKAQKLEREYNEIDNGADQTAWKENNYVYVADHLVGAIDFETGEWQEYPYRDFYYREQGGKN